MARHNIQFKGIRHAPSDITGQDGDLLECVNLVHDGGELKPIEMPERELSLQMQHGRVLAAVHNVVGDKIFVEVLHGGIGDHISAVRADGTPVWFGKTRDKTIEGQTVQWVETVGNTLIIGTDKSTHYALYKNSQYKWLGDKLPQPVFEFDIGKNWGGANMPNYKDESKYYNISEPNPYALDGNGDTVSGGGIPCAPAMNLTAYVYYLKLVSESKENKKIVRDNLLAKIADLESSSKKDGRFIYPFMARYAIRMYDGNYAMHSAPILFLPSTLKCPILAYLSVFSQKTPSTGNIQTFVDLIANITVMFKAKSLRLRFKGFFDEDGNKIPSDNWEDVIKSVDLFLSSQVVTFDKNVYEDEDNIPIRYYNPTTSHNLENGLYVPDYGYSYDRNECNSWLQNHFLNGFDLYQVHTYTYEGVNIYDAKNYFFPLPSKGIEKVREEIENTNLFYRVKSFSLEDLKQSNNTAWGYLHDKIEYGLLERLETHPTLPDDYVSRCRMAGNVNYNYNQRLVLGNIKLQAPKWYLDSATYSFDKLRNTEIYFYIEKQDKQIVIEYKCNTGDRRLGKYDFGHYLFYPDVDCKKATVLIQDDVGATVGFDVLMTPHSGLNGSYALMPDLKSAWESYEDFEPTGLITTPDTSDRYYNLPNTIAMSSVANPFHFPATNFKDIGRAKVLGIAANVLDVSNGQWGQYPLHVFCSDGIISVAIDAEGKMSRIDAVSSDILKEPLGISQPTLIQTNQMLVFLTQRGVMSISGTKPQALSLMMDGRHFNAMTELADVDYHVGAFANLISRTSDATAFRDYAESGFLAYDYAHNRVLLLRPDRDYQYVLSLDTMMWSKQIVYTNLASFQLETIPTNTQQDRGGMPLLKVKPIRAAVNNYTEMYLQDTEGWLYKTMSVMGENNLKQLYQYGYFISRPVRFDTDEYKSITRLLHEYTHYSNKSFVRMALYGSRDGVRYGRINSLRGMGYKYFIFAVYTYLKPNERYSYMSVEFEPRLTNKIR